MDRSVDRWREQNLERNQERSRIKDQGSRIKSREHGSKKLSSNVGSTQQRDLKQGRRIATATTTYLCFSQASFSSAREASARAISSAVCSGHAHTASKACTKATVRRKTSGDPEGAPISLARRSSRSISRNFPWASATSNALVGMRAVHIHWIVFCVWRDRRRKQ